MSISDVDSFNLDTLIIFVFLGGNSEGCTECRKVTELSAKR